VVGRIWRVRVVKWESGTRWRRGRGETVVVVVCMFGGFEVLNGAVGGGRGGRGVEERGRPVVLVLVVLLLVVGGAPAATLA
jgi:hypothetical protein